MNILVSACLLGIPCRYSGTGCYHEDIANLKESHYLIPVCPEQLGGLSTPRDPVELTDGNALTKKRIDVTSLFQKGATETLRIAKLFHCTLAILKSNSPSCGYRTIYDGTFTGKLVSGNGITAEVLINAGIKVLNETELPDTKIDLIPYDS